ncbi:hypothetical protein SARC_02791 [Sphaeroforma arctica JP610]|uniref:N-acetyltransferase ESCO zinc-finger domain-containing protein n=1 Tax=Sphaeroforma arctica JP610 TaxID=667725 RepID=A0A0L0G7I9_9EUKA|nr:hypothetical protein SARC_02791 [Sphaeroforma arctica JP610]KNC85002.1 hypothetical protein SARC_02791 [Sphaeroforma arctica JP610]|eukprot:XP_014158904.1 hypothetical protein SARC_02791 [Sphaeroforma arctica JP610]
MLDAHKREICRPSPPAIMRTYTRKRTWQRKEGQYTRTPVLLYEEKTTTAAEWQAVVGDVHYNATDKHTEAPRDQTSPAHTTTGQRTHTSNQLPSSEDSIIARKHASSATIQSPEHSQLRQHESALAQHESEVQHQESALKPLCASPHLNNTDAYTGGECLYATAQAKGCDDILSTQSRRRESAKVFPLFNMCKARKRLKTSNKENNNRHSPCFGRSDNNKRQVSSNHVPTSKTLCSGSKLVDRKVQMVIDLGQTSLGVLVCKDCGMTYNGGDSEDVAEHQRFHTKYFKDVTFAGWKNERRVAESLILPDDVIGRIICIHQSDQPTHLKKAQQVQAFVDLKLGLVQMDTVLSQSAKTYLCIANRKVIGCVVAEKLAHAYRAVVLPGTYIGTAKKVTPATKKSPFTVKTHVPKKPSEAKQQPGTKVNTPAGHAERDNSEPPTPVRFKTRGHRARDAQDGTDHASYSRGKFEHNDKKSSIAQSQQSPDKQPHVEEGQQCNTPRDTGTHSVKPLKQRPYSHASSYQQRTRVPAHIGISRVWVAEKYRRKGVIKALITATRNSFTYNDVVPMEAVAFSQGTVDGDHWTEACVETKGYLTYE